MLPMALSSPIRVNLALLSATEGEKFTFTVTASDGLQLKNRAKVLLEISDL
jgi:hypothetical protein